MEKTVSYKRMINQHAEAYLDSRLGILRVFCHLCLTFVNNKNKVIVEFQYNPEGN